MRSRIFAEPQSLYNISRAQLLFINYPYQPTFRKIKMNRNASEQAKIVVGPLDSRSLRSLPAFQDFPWLNGIVLFDGSLQEKLEQMLKSMSIPENYEMAITVCPMRLFERVSTRLNVSLFITRYSQKVSTRWT
jgi:hypothetical protein